MKNLQLTLLYLCENDNILLAMKKRGFGRDMYNGVGGKVDPGETIEQAMVRECQEEIGATPTKYTKVGYLVFDEHHENVRKLMHIHVFIATDWTGDVVETEEMQPKWFNEKSIPFSKMWPADKLWLPSVLAGKQITGEFSLNEDNSVDKFDFREVANLLDRGK
ncbi:8-oxo-dGTP diphosphatase [Candidatus Saccharibacteria bacterium]|nr:8-oxo-dGTP diphosphatase [Candidatus Saccharibacteria bacterium]